jgi:hypothetical protein
MLEMKSLMHPLQQVEWPHCKINGIYF